jgi:hypothetical protein
LLFGQVLGWLRASIAAQIGNQCGRHGHTRFRASNAHGDHAC